MSGVTVVNFAHPLTDAQRAQLEALTGGPLTRLIDVPAQFDGEAPFGPQVEALLTATGLTSEQWQTLQLIINPPSFAPIVALLLARLHGLMGYFPTIVRIAPVPGALPPRFAVAELVDLQTERDHARLMRTKE